MAESTSKPGRRLSPDLVRVVSGMPEPVLLLTADSTILNTNRSAAMLLQKASADLPGEKLSRLVSDDPEKLGRYLRLCARTADALPGGIRVRAGHGETIPCKTLGGLAQPEYVPAVIWLRLLPHEIASSQFVALNERIRAVVEKRKANHERQQATLALHTSEERFRLLVEGVQDYAIFLLDPEGRVATWNFGAERMKGYRADEVVGRHFSMFCTRQDVAEGVPEKELHAAATTGHTETEGWLVRKDGSKFWAHTIISALRAGDGALIAFSKVTRDLTKQKAAHEALELQVNVLQCMPGIAWTLTPDGANDFVNSQWLEYTGQTAEFFRSEPQAWMSALHPDDRKEVSRSFWTGIRSGHGFTMEARFRRASDGAYRWHLNRAVPVHDSAGNLVKFIGTSTDIEAMKQASVELSNAEERTRMIIDSALDAVITMNVEGEITGWNRQAEALFGWTAAEAVGRAMAEMIIPERYRAAHTRGFEHFLATGEGPILNSRIEVSARRRDGSEFPAELTVSAARLEHGWTFSAFVRDITARKLAEQKLRDSERNLRLMTETIPEMLWSATPEGAVDYCNARVLDYTGLTAGEIRDTGWMSAIHPDDADPMAQAWMASVRAGAPFRFEFRGLRAADRTYRWCVSSALPLVESGRITRWYGTVVDLHDWRQAEEALRQAQTELARVSRITAMGEITASIAHEVNQPLAALVASGDSCLAWLSGSPPNLQKARAAVERMTQAATQASEVVERLRALFKKQPPKRVHLRIGDLIEETISLVRNDAVRKDVLLRVEVAGGLPMIAADRVQIQQVILNLILNGMDAMAANEIEDRRLLVRAQQDEPGRILVAVSDSGPGVQTDHSSRVFDPFFTTKPGGTGMGLSISRSIIEAHGGRLWTTPNQPRGAVFQFVLPVEAETA